MTYTELLSQEAWRIKCNEILQRDSFKCRYCGCVGYHNGGNFIKIESLDEVDELLKDYIFYNWKFSEYYETLSRQISIVIERSTPHDIECDKIIEYDDLAIARFNKPIHRDITDVDSFPIIYPQNHEPSKVIQRSHGWGINKKDGNNNVGEILEFIFPYDYSGIFVSIEQEDGVDHIVLQIDNRLFALIIPSRLKFHKGLNIHHSYYIYGKNPWDYKSDALITLCEDCHKKAHESLIKVYHQGSLYKYAMKCPRCGGSGYLPQYSYYEHGICFKCGGEGAIMDEVENATGTGDDI